MPSDKERITVLEYRMSRVENGVGDVTEGLKGLLQITKAQAELRQKDALMMATIVGAMCKVMPSFGEALE